MRTSLLALMLLAATGASANDIAFPCSSLGSFHEAMKVRKATIADLTPEQWQFARGLFAMAPDTPASLPPGDHAVLVSREDGSVDLVFIDGEQACAPMKLQQGGIDLLTQVREGTIVHSGHGL